MYWLFAGRALQGIGVGLTTGAGAAALVEYNPTSNKKLPGSINTITQAVGVFLATIIGASLIKYAPVPLHLSYWVLSLLVFFSIIISTRFITTNIDNFFFAITFQVRRYDEKSIGG